MANLLQLLKKMDKLNKQVVALRKDVQDFKKAENVKLAQNIRLGQLKKSG